MSETVIEPIGLHRDNLQELLDEAGAGGQASSGINLARGLAGKWDPMIAGGTGFVLLEGSEYTGLLLYSTEYELRFSSFLSAPSIEKLPKSATIHMCHVLERARDASASNEQLLLRSAVARLRLDRSIETIAVQISPSYELDVRTILDGMGFASCRRVEMELELTGRIPRGGPPPGCTIEAAAPECAEALRSTIYHGYFAEIDGYLFPDIAAVCSDDALFREFLDSNAMNHGASVIARMQDYPCGCIMVLSDEGRRRGLIAVVAVVPNMRRRGIARAMLLRVLLWLQEHNHERAALAVTVENQPALSLYSTLGFEETGPRTAISVWRRSVSRPRMNSRL